MNDFNVLLLSKAFLKDICGGGGEDLINMTNETFRRRAENCDYFVGYSGVLHSESVIM